MPINYIFPAIILSILFIFIGYSVYLDSLYLKKLTSGEYSLECYIDNQYKVIDPHKILFIKDNTYVFTNGYAKNCEVIKL